MEKNPVGRPKKHKLTNINVEANQADCAYCGSVEIKWVTNRGTKRASCSVGYKSHKTKWWENNPTYKNITAGNNLRAHGLTHLEAQKLREGKRCAICSSKHDLVVDHCHKQNRVRDILCNRCNIGIGMFGDDVEMLERALTYLSVHKERMNKDE